MSTITDRIDNRFRALNEELGNTSWKDPDDPDYDRQWAEDALYHTIGPLTDNPRWAQTWTSPSEPVPGFTPGGPAPRWTPEELVYAFAGDPNLLMARGKSNPRSPQYGNKGGSPLYRTARKVARVYNRGTDPSFISDMYSNGFISLLRLMQPGQDKSMAAFISFAIRHVQSAMEHGIGGEVRTKAAAGQEAQLGDKGNKITARGLKSLLDETNPEELRKAAGIVKGEYREQQKHDKNPNNPFGYFSAPYYQTVMYYADALESGDEQSIAASRQAIKDLIEQIEDYNTMIGGASTGLGQAIDTPDRKSSIGIASMDAPSGEGEDDAGGMAANIPGEAEDESFIDQESIRYILDIALNHDLGKILATSEKYNAMAAKMGAKKGKIGGKMTVNELRYVIRTLGQSGSSYPGKGRPRSNTDIPRDSRGWWLVGEDPEIEPLPVSEDVGTDPIYEGLWHSIWSRNGYESMGPQAIATEMTAEVEEFRRFNIPTARDIKEKTKGGKTFKEAVSKVAVANTVKAATVKLKIIADIYSDSFGLDESILRNSPIMEDVRSLDKLDRQIIAESANTMVRKMQRVLALEKSPPGWKGTVKAMKSHDEIDNPYALAWSMKKKGAKPHYKDDDSGKKKEEYKEDRMQPVDALIYESERFTYRGVYYSTD